MSKSPLNFVGAIAGAAGFAGSRISRGDKIRNGAMQNMMGSGGIGSLFGGGAFSKLASILGRRRNRQRATMNKAEIQAMQSQLQPNAADPMMGKPVIDQGLAGAVKSKLDTSTLSKNFSLPSVDASLMDPRVASRAVVQKELPRARASFDYATGGRASFGGNFVREPYRIGGRGGLGTFIDGRGSASTRDPNQVIGGVDVRHAGLTEEQVNSNASFTDLFSKANQY